MAHKVVVTGIGWVTPLGHDIETVWQRLLQGESGIDSISHFDASTFPTQIAGEVRDYDHTGFTQLPEAHTGTGRNVGYVLGAASMAWKSAGLDEFDAKGELDHERLGIYLGSGEGIIDFDRYVASNLAGWDAEAREVDGKKWVEAARELLTADGEIEQEPNMPLAHLAMEFNAQGPAYNCLTACAASTQAIGEAMHILQHGDADVMITGGAHTMLHPLGVTGFNRLTALSNRNDDPKTASRPFSRDRDGFVIGEGSGILILETEEHALRRGATILAEIAGYGSTADAYRITDIHPEGRGASQAMRLAMEKAGVGVEEIDYISAHGTSTKENDSIESRAVKAVFGDRAKQVPISSIKSMLGHLIAAAGATEAIVCVLAIRDQALPPTINLHDPDVECDLDYIPNEARRTEVETCLTNSFGFGGQNDTLIIRRYASA